MTRARCELDERCRNPASVHLMNPTLRVCTKCAEELRRAATEAKFPRAAAMLRATAISACLRQAADELDAIAGNASSYEEVSTLRRRIREVVIGVAAFADGTTCEEAES